MKALFWASNVSMNLNVRTVLMTWHPKLYEFLALIDALRVGRARERNIAAQEIESRLSELVLENK